ncbi:MAG: DNA translocase FtsK 4TM domain-containing protein, partial [Bacteroidales bacterium]|nr:DNA translocase FtsK 4TM domain-containing protein [Bacteroidales bacterium]
MNKQKKQKELPAHNGPLNILIGLAILVLAALVLIGELSYLFHWKQDASLLTGAQNLIGEASGVENQGGVLGMKMGHFLVADCFGLASFAVVYIICLVAWYIAVGMQTRVFVKRLLLGVTSMVLLSAILSFASSLVGPDVVFECGLGGASGKYLSGLLCTLTGKIVTG